VTAGQRLTTYLFAACAVVLVVTMVLYSDHAFQAAGRGLRVWWEVVFPALLPFFIGAEILLALGVVHFMGALLEPLMRPLFNVPGVGSFVMAMGLASGYPIGSILTARMRSQRLCSRLEGERLMSFTNTADPLFMSGAVAVGMFGRPAVAGILMAAHYLSSLSVGLLLRFYGREEKPAPGGAGLAIPSRTAGNTLGRAMRALVEAREQDGRPLGRIFGDAVKSSVNTLLMIGGFIILFSVVIDALRLAGVVGLLAGTLGSLLAPLGLEPACATALVSGLFEITIGTQEAASVAAPLAQQLVLAGMIIAWSGLSVHAQVAAMIQGTDLTIAPYVVSRFLHAALAGVYTTVLIGAGYSLPVLPALALGAGPGGTAAWLATFGYSCRSFAAVTLLLSLTALLAWPAGRLGIIALCIRGPGDRRLRSLTRPDGPGPRP